MFGPGFGAPELLIIAFIVLLVFGGSKLTDLGSSLGKGIREFRQAVREDDTDKKETASKDSKDTPSSG